LLFTGQDSIEEDIKKKLIESSERTIREQKITRL
jgi:hypothetical protein